MAYKGFATPPSRGTATTKTRKERETWSRDMKSFDGKTEEDMVSMLIEDNVIFDWEGRTCPHCGAAKMGPRYTLSDGRVVWRCTRGRTCGKQVRPCHAHPVFQRHRSK